MVNNTYAFQEIHKSAYYTDNYSVLTGNSITFEDGHAALRNSRTNPKLQNFWGNGSLGDQAYKDNSNLNPTSMYFRKLVIGDDIYGNHIQGIYGDNGMFNINDEVILYKKHCCSKEHYGEIGKYDICRISKIMYDGDGHIRYLVEGDITNEYLDTTANTATLVLEYENLTIEGLSYLDTPDGNGNYNVGSRDSNLREIFHPEKGSPWFNRSLTDSSGILYIKVKNTFTMKDNAKLYNFRGYWGGYQYHKHSNLNIRVGQNITTNSWGNYSSPIAWLAALNDNQNKDGAITYDDICDFQPFPIPLVTCTNGSSSRTSGSFNRDTPYTSKIIPSDYVPVSMTDKLWLGLPGGMSVVTNTSYGSDGGGIIVIQAKNAVIGTDALISTKAISRQASHHAIMAPIGCGGTVVLKSEEVTTKGTPFLSTLLHNNNDNIGTWRFDQEGMHNPGLTIFECMKYTVNATTYTDFSTPESVQASIYSDDIVYNYITTNSVDVDAVINCTTAYTEGTVGTTYRLDSNYSIPKYETNKFFKLYTKGVRNVSTDNWTTLDKFVITGNEDTTQTMIRVLLSIDSGNTWVKLNPDTNSFQQIDINNIADGNTIKELNDYLDYGVLTNSLLVGSTTKTIDIAIGLKTTLSHLTPTIDDFKFVYSGEVSIGPPVRLLPTHEGEFDSEDVDFVWLMPQSNKGSVHNRIEISSTSDFTPRSTSVDMSSEVSKFPIHNDLLQLPYLGRKYDNFNNNMHTLINPYMVQRTDEVRSTQDEGSLSVKRNITTGQIDIVGDVWSIEGKVVKLPNSSIDIPTPTTDLANDILPADWTLDLTKEETIVCSVQHNLKLSDNVSYLGKGTRFANSGLGYLIPAANANADIRTRLGGKSIHVKFRKESSANCHLLSWRAGTVSTVMGYIKLYKNYIVIGKSTIADPSNTYFQIPNFEDSGEVNLTIVVMSDNSYKLYVNGYYIFTDTVFWVAQYQSSGTTDVSMYIGCDAVTTAGVITNGLTGVIHEVSFYERQLSDTEVKSISKTPNYLLRYDLTEAKYKWFQLPVSNNSIDYRNPMWEKELPVSSRQNVYGGNILMLPNSVAYYSNNKTLDIGKWIDAGYGDAFKVSKQNTVIHQNGNYNIQLDVVDFDTYFTRKANNSVTWYNLPNRAIFTRVGRVAKRHTILEVDFVFSEQNWTIGTSIGVAWGLDSSSFDSGSWVWEIYQTKVGEKILSQTSKSMGNTSAILDYDMFTPGRYTLRVKPGVAGAQSRIIVELESQDVEAYKIPVVIFDSINITPAGASKLYGYMTSDYDDMLVTDNGDYAEPGVLTRGQNGSTTSDIQGNIHVIGLAVSDGNSNQINTSGYVDEYFIDSIFQSTLDNIVKIEVDSDVTSASTNVYHTMSFDDGLTWKTIDFETRQWSNVTSDNIGMSDGVLYSCTARDFTQGGFGNDRCILRTYLTTTNPNLTPSVKSIKSLINGPRMIDSWNEPGSSYDGRYKWFYTASGNWNPYLEVDTSEGNAYGWVPMGTEPPSPIVFKDGAGARPSTNLHKVFGTVKIDCKPKGVWYWRIYSYNGQRS